jgi:hypothetical protein
MIRAYRLYTGADGNSHVVRGSVTGGELVEAESILFKETPAHSSFDWHNDPIPQYVITLAAVCSNLQPWAARHSRSIRVMSCWRWITPAQAISGV